MDFQNSWSCGRLKQELLEHLKNVGTFNHILKFCDLLITGQRVIKQSKNTIGEDSNHMSELLQKSDAVLEQINNVITSVSAEVLIEKLSEALDKEIRSVDKRNLKSFLSKINQKSSITSLEYLDSLIYYFDHLVKLYFNSELFISYFPIFEPMKNFTELNCLVRCATYKSSKTILDIILQITIDKVEVTSEEKKLWQRLFLEAADVINKFVRWDASFQFLRLQHILRLRSCIQCVLDFLADCPIEYRVLLSELDKISYCKDILDYHINQKCKLPSTCEIDFYNYMLADSSIGYDIKIGNDNKNCDDSDDDSDDDVEIGDIKIVLSSDDDNDSDDNFESINDPNTDDYVESDVISKMPQSHIWWHKLKQDSEYFKV